MEEFGSILYGLFALLLVILRISSTEGILIGGGEGTWASMSECDELIPAD